MSSNNSIESILEREGFYVFVGYGNSMWPLIREGVDTVEIQPCKTDLRPGDLALFRYEGRYTLHRVVKVEDGNYVMRGDNCVAREKVQKEAVFGVVTGLWRGNRKLSLDSFTYRFYRFGILRCPRIVRFIGKVVR